MATPACIQKPHSAPTCPSTGNHQETGCGELQTGTPSTHWGSPAPHSPSLGRSPPGEGCQTRGTVAGQGGEAGL